MSIYEFFFFRAEDCIRDLTVTGVQTCALPISALAALNPGSRSGSGRDPANGGSTSARAGTPAGTPAGPSPGLAAPGDTPTSEGGLADPPAPGTGSPPRTGAGPQSSTSRKPPTGTLPC